jgi:BASS family bile acid:Na+ symporter
MLERFLILWLCLLSWVAYIWPENAPIDPFVGSRQWLPLVIVVTMFAIGWLLPPDEVRQVIQRWPLVLAGTTLQYGSMPLLAWIVAHVYALDADLRLGLILAGCVPGAMASNVLTLVARGNVSYSLSLTTAATCLSPVCVPVMLQLTLQQQLPKPLLPLVWQLIWMVVLPVVFGHALGRFVPQWRRWAEAIGKRVAAVAILWIIAVVVGVNRGALGDVEAAALAAVLSLNLAGYVAGRLGGWLLRLPPSMQRALTLEIGMQNAGLGTALASDLFHSQPRVMIPTALYTFGCMLTGTVLARYWALRPEDEP